MIILDSPRSPEAPVGGDLITNSGSMLPPDDNHSHLAEKCGTGI